MSPGVVFCPGKSSAYYFVIESGRGPRRSGRAVVSRLGQGWVRGGRNARRPAVRSRIEPVDRHPCSNGGGDHVVRQVRNVSSRLQALLHSGSQPVAKIDKLPGLVDSVPNVREGPSRKSSPFRDVALLEVAVVAHRVTPLFLPECSPSQ